jgi:hypothetical protein
MDFSNTTLNETDFTITAPTSPSVEFEISFGLEIATDIGASSIGSITDLLEEAIKEQITQTLANSAATAKGFEVKIGSVPILSNGGKDLCAKLTPAWKCKSRVATSVLGCAWRGRKCVTVATVQPQAMTPCTGACCTLNRNSCLGKGSAARKWKKKYRREVKKSCKWTNDRTLQILSPDGKNYGKCATKDWTVGMPPAPPPCGQHVCCSLKFNACRGKGRAAKVFKRKYRQSPKKRCRWKVDKSKTYRTSGKWGYCRSKSRN